MRKRVKDLAYTIGVHQRILTKLATSLDKDEFKSYRSWEEQKYNTDGSPKIKNGAPETRSFDAPKGELKFVQRRLLHRALCKIKLPDYFYGGVKGKDGVLNARFHQGNKYFLLTDFQNFYPSIRSREVESALRKEGFYPDVARIITRLTTKGGRVPQGGPSSSFLASLVLSQKAKSLFESLKLEGFKISVFVDDVTISSPFDFKNSVSRILHDLRSIGLKIHHKKTYYKSLNPVVTGTVVKNNGICATSSTYDALRDESRSLPSKQGYLERIKYIKRISAENL